MTTYYVDWTGGNDGLAGTSPATAWKTLTNLYSTWGDNDSVLLKYGETWTVDGSATALRIRKNNTYAGAYGDAELGLPRLIGTQGVAAPVNTDGVSVCTIENLYVSGGYAQTLYIYNSNQITVRHLHSINSVLLIRLCDIVEVDDCLIESGSYYGSPLYIGLYTLYTNDETNITIKQSTIIGNERECLDTKPTVNGMLVYQNHFYNARNTGIDIRGENIEIYHNVIHNIYGVNPQLQGIGIAGYYGGGRGNYWNLHDNVIFNADIGIRLQANGIGHSVISNAFCDLTGTPLSFVGGTPATIAGNKKFLIYNHRGVEFDGVVAGHTW